MDQRLFVKPVLRGKRGVAFCDHEVEAMNYVRLAAKSDSEIRAIVLYLETTRTNATALADLLDLPRGKFYETLDAAGAASGTPADKQLPTRQSENTPG